MMKYDFNAGNRYCTMRNELRNMHGFSWRTKNAMPWMQDKKKNCAFLKKTVKNFQKKK